MNKPEDPPPNEPPLYPDHAAVRPEALDFAPPSFPPDPNVPKDLLAEKDTEPSPHELMQQLQRLTSAVSTLAHGVELLKSEHREERKLLKQYVSNELQSLNTTLGGELDGTRNEIRDQLSALFADIPGRVGAAVDRAVDRHMTPIKAHLDRFVKVAQDTKIELEGLTAHVKDISKLAYDLARSKAVSDSDSDNADRATLAEVKS